MPDSLSRYSLEELEQLLAEIIQTIDLREQAAGVSAAAVAGEQIDAVVPHATDLAADPAQPLASLTAAAALQADEVAEDEEDEPQVRYVHPASRNLSWSGEGAIPDWVTAYLAYGGSWSAMEYAAEQYLEGLAKRKALHWPPPRKSR